VCFASYANQLACASPASHNPTNPPTSPPRYLGPGGSNVLAAWSRGYTGTGVNIVFNDDGLDYRHPDFKDKYKQEGSTMDPMPGVCGGDHPDTHGTTCAGIAAGAKNDKCGVGVAYGATVSAGNLFRDGEIAEQGHFAALCHAAFPLRAHLSLAHTCGAPPQCTTPPTTPSSSSVACAPT